MVAVRWIAGSPKTEAANMRRYFVEKGGFLVFDDCGVNAPAQAMIRLFLAQMRYVMPEYQIERIPNDHEVYDNFYEMGGPPVGFDIFWWGTRPPKRNYLEGISVGEKLSVIVVRRDYMCAMEVCQSPDTECPLFAWCVPFHDQRCCVCVDTRLNFGLLRLCA